MLGFASLGAATAACSSTAVTTPDPNADGGTNPGDDSGTNTNNDGGTTGGSAKTGTVSLSQTIVGTTFVQYNASASFLSSTGGTTGGGGGTSTCDTASEGGCVVTTCDKATTTADAGTGGDAGSLVGVSAGDITVEALKTITLSFDSANGAYTPQSAQEKLFDTGGQIHISAVGADVPAFDDTIAAPPALTFTAPVAPAAGAKLAVDTTKAFDFTWTGGAAGTLDVIMGFQSSTQTSSVICQFDASTGNASVPATLMAKVVKGDGSIITQTLTHEALTAGDYTVNLSASQNGALYSATAQ